MKKNKDEVQFISLSEDGIFKTLWLLGSDEVKKKLKSMISNIVGYDISDYENIGIELGKITYSSIFNKTDLLLLNKKENKLLNIELNRYKYSNYNNKNNSYLYKIAGEYYNYVGIKSNSNYSAPIKASQININCFKCPENESIITSTFQMVDIENNLIDKSVTKTSIYIDKDLNKCYDNDIIKDYLMFVCDSYDEMKMISDGDEGRIAIMENLKRLGGDIAFTDHINSTIDNKIIEAQILREEIETEMAGKIKEVEVKIKEAEGKAKEAEGKAKEAEDKARETMEEQAKVVKKLLSQGVPIEMLATSMDKSIDDVKKMCELSC